VVPIKPVDESIFGGRVIVIADLDRQPRNRVGVSPLVINRRRKVVLVAVILVHPHVNVVGVKEQLFGPGAANVIVEEPPPHLVSGAGCT